VQNTRYEQMLSCRNEEKSKKKLRLGHAILARLGTAFEDEMRTNLYFGRSIHNSHTQDIWTSSFSCQTLRILVMCHTKGPPRFPPPCPEALSILPGW